MKKGQPTRVNQPVFDTFHPITIPAPSAAAQRHKILAALKVAGGRGCTTVELRHGIGIMHPAARIMELRESGLEILKRWDIDRTPDGQPHRVARYCLIGSAEAKHG